ncbi:MAG: DNA polymerase III subunit beta [Bacteroidales bacterium]|nr:DNA polymerase III subunit beta [Bacteroidales bacterium]
MKFIVNRDVLFKNLSAVSGALSNNNTMPILDNFLFTVSGSILTVTASDLDTTISATVELMENDGEGAVAVPSKTLMETLKLTADMPIIFNINPETFVMHFTAGKGEYDVACVSGDEYPSLSKLTEAKSFEIDAAILQRAIGKTLFATSNDELRPNMTGVFCELASDSVTFVSTDGHKLVRYRNMKVHADDFASFILPKKPLNQLKNILANVSENVKVEYSAETNHIQFSFDNIILFSSLKEGTYPSYDKVIPKENHNSFIVERGEFLRCIRRTSLYSNQSTYQVRISLADEMTTISAEDIDFSNKAQETITGQYTGEALNIGFNAKFLREMIETLDSNEIRIEMSQPNAPALIFPHNNPVEDEDILMLIMPVMLSNY